MASYRVGHGARWDTLTTIMLHYRRGSKAVMMTVSVAVAVEALCCSHSGGTSGAQLVPAGAWRIQPPLLHVPVSNRCC